MKRKVFLTFIVMLVFILGPGAVAGWPEEFGQDQGFTEDLTELSLEALMEKSITITSLGKKEQHLFDTSSAIYVISREDIKRSGATNIPEALRMVPGMHVARIDSNKWAVGVRGFNSQYFSKIFVMIDNRSIYSPLYSTVFWDMQHPLLADVERIEVIRGPGASLWGANAVNGVVNVITRKAKDSQGGLLTGGGGTEERGFGGVRYGGKAGDDVYYRVYAKYFDRDDFVDLDGHDADDDWDGFRSGFQTEWEVSEDDMVMVEGDIYDSDAGQTITMTGLLIPPYSQTMGDEAEMFGGNMMVRWEHDFSADSDMAVQLYYEGSDREEALLREKRDTFDFDSQHLFKLGDRHEVMWGLGYHFSTDDIHNSETFSLDPDNRDIHLASAFVQDEISFMEDRLFLTVGSKLEHNDYTGFEFQPSVRLLGKPHDDHRVWAAVSRAVRTPSRFEDDLRFNYQTSFYPPEFLALVLSPAVLPLFPDGALIQVAGIGDHDFESEDLLAFELGYRVKPSKKLLLDAAAFYNYYDNLWTVEPGSAFLEMTPLPHLVMPIVFDNKMRGETYGGEFAVHWDVMDRWRLSGGYSWLKVQLDLKKSSNIPSFLALMGSSGFTPPVNFGEGDEGNAPQNQIHLRTYFDLPRDFEFDAAVYYVDSLVNMGISSYTRLDTRLGWSPIEDLDLDLVFQNLLDSEHQEFTTINVYSPTQVQRSVYGRLTWRF